METHKILLNGQWIYYTLRYKNMRSVRIKVEKGELVVSAPKYTSLKFIEETIIQYQSRLLPQITNYQPYVIYQNQGYVEIFHQRYQIILRDIGQRQCCIHDKYLYVYHSDIEKTVDTFLKQMLLDYIEERVIYYLARDFDIDMPQIQIKKYKSRWGSCYYKNNRISFHFSLIHLEKDLIDYVIVHELTHFLQANHSAMFYQELAKRMPDYKQREKRLKEKHI